MKVTELEPLLQREPFRPFTVRLSNGAIYEFREPRDLGAPRKMTHTLIYFGPDADEPGWVLIDLDHIVEVFNP